MADNISILDSSGTPTTVATTDTAGVHTPKHIVTSIPSAAIASGAIASGAIASGAIASGAIASGAIASGAIAAGAIAAGATSIADNEDAASASGDRGVKVLAVQLATPADSAGTDGDYSFLQMSGGRLWCSSVVTTVGGQSFTFGAGSVAAGTQRTTLASDDPAVASLGVMDDWDNAASDGASVSGDVAHDTADAGEPVKIGGKATASLSGATNVAAGDRANIPVGLDGAPIFRPHTCLEDIVSGNASNTDGTSTQCIAAGAAGVKHYITSIILTNTSSSNIYVEIKDDTTVKVTIPLPANSGCVFNPPVPIPGSAATAWNFDPSAAATTVYCSMIGFKSKI